MREVERGGVREEVAWTISLQCFLQFCRFQFCDQDQSPSPQAQVQQNGNLNEFSYG